MTTVADADKAAIYRAITALYEGRYLDTGMPDISAMIAEDGYISDAEIYGAIDMFDNPAWDMQRSFETPRTDGRTQTHICPPNGLVKAAGVCPPPSHEQLPTWTVS